MMSDRLIRIGLSILAVVGVASCSDEMPTEAPTAAAPPNVAAAARVLEEIHYIKASNPGYGDQFGTGGTLLGNAVALSDDGATLAVGATFEASGDAGPGADQSDDSVYGAGAVYVFANEGGAWAQQAYIKASTPGLTDNFGYAVQLSEDGDTMAVSAYFEASGATGINGDEADDSIPQAGAVYIFVRDGSSWSQQAYIKASNTLRRPQPETNELSPIRRMAISSALRSRSATTAIRWPSARSPKTAPLARIPATTRWSRLGPSTCSTGRGRRGNRRRI